jgi:hypothetical protein
MLEVSVAGVGREDLVGAASLSPMSLSIQVISKAGALS